MGGCQNAGITKSWASIGGPDDGICQQSNNVDGCWDGGDCCTYSCFQLNGEFKELGSDGKTWQFSHRCFNLNDTIDCIDPVFKVNNFSTTINLELLDYFRPTKPLYKEDDKQDNNQCDVTIDLIGKYINGSSISSLSFCEAFSNYLCSNITFARTRIECNVEISKLIPDTCNGGKLPRCKPRTMQNCQCKEEWSYTNTDSTVFQFYNHSCGNPFLSPGYHHNNWCDVVPGSCLNTISGNPGAAGSTYYYDSTQSPPSWWDNCGSGAADATTGKLLNAGEGTNMKWTEANKQEAIPIAFAGTAINKTINMQILRVVTMNIDNGDSSTSTIGPGKMTVGTTTTLAPVVESIEAKFELSSTSEDVTAAELSTSTMKNAIAGNIAAAINVPANTVSIIAIYDCPGDDVRCDDGKRMRHRRRLLQGRKIVIEFKVIGSSRITAKAEEELSNAGGNTFTSRLESSLATSISNNLGKTVTIIVAKPVIVKKSGVIIGTSTTTTVGPSLSGGEDDEEKRKKEMEEQMMMLLIGGIIILISVCCIGGAICYCCNMKSSTGRKRKEEKGKLLKTYELQTRSVDGVAIVVD